MSLPYILKEIGKEIFGDFKWQKVGVRNLYSFFVKFKVNIGYFRYNFINLFPSSL
jgi:hypothetical protein